MRLWTVHPVEVLTEIEKKGRYICQPDKSTYLDWGTDFKNAYDWISNQMQQRGIEKPKGVTYPVWAWHTYCSKRGKLDLRKRNYLGEKGESVCLEIEVPDNEVLLSDYFDWHQVLNNAPLVSDDLVEDDEKFDAEWERISRGTHGELEESWLGVFDVSNSTDIQATFWVLDENMIKDVRRFTVK